MWSAFCALLLAITGTSGFVNLAHTLAQGLQGTANMSQSPQNSAWSAGKAVDGNTDQELLTTCAVMDYSKNYNSVWWKVRLSRRFNVAYLEVYFRNSSISRATGYYFYSYDSTEVFDPNSPNPNNLIYHHDPMSGCPASVQNITVNRLAQEIVFINKRPPGYNSTCVGDSLEKTTVEICEVKVMGCDTNRYNSCNQTCDSKCKNRNCDVFNGSCIYGCTDPDALTVYCIDCQDGQYISNRQCIPCQGHCKIGAHCNKSTGLCDYGCENHWTGDFCNSCPPGYYGNDCHTQCGKCAGNDVCDNKSGDCPRGCRENWQEPRCYDCMDGFFDYARDCAGKCGHCKNNNICTKDAGYCPNGCKSNFLAPMCQVCKPGFYNRTSNCTNRCGQCRDYTACDSESGRCPGGCKPHFKDPVCQVCRDGFYNSRCTSQCGKCVNDAPCDKVTGECRNGCQQHFEPPLCQVCEDGFYNSRCSSVCGKCLNNEPCDKVTGECRNGCQLHFNPPLCQDCSDGYYGNNCLTACGNCLHEKGCDPINGTCYHGCKKHFSDPKCIVCEDGFYNSRCNSKCGKCVNNEPCDKVTGECRNGCQLDLEPPLCQDDINPDLQGNTMINKDGRSFSWSLVVIGILAILLAVSIAFNVFLKRQMPSVQHDEQSTERKSKSRGQKPSQNYDNLTVLKESHQYASMNSETNNSQYEELPERIV
uniref:Multiple epidermal growth factor-like domains protein 10 n=1 Tax=Crassostrea virginica TaxID=6565 RepID=A0A8B8BS80_CRAVI|nr:multiple epidermal growth factor-like domains protein 10 [Crassostrea virginica]